jgi:glycosyltransferase involved in cell wall biosynthesis
MKVRCDFAGSVTQEQLKSFYQISDLLLVLSDHEGFCVPILEAFHHQVPVIAYAAGAIPETAGEGALLFQDRDPQFSAHLISRVLQDRELRSELQRKGNAVLQRHQQFPVKQTLMRIIEEVRSIS